MAAQDSDGTHTSWPRRRSPLSSSRRRRVPTTPTARAATSCSAPTATSTASTTGSASTSDNKLRTCSGAGSTSRWPEPAVEVIGKLRADCAGWAGALAEHLTGTEVAEIVERIDRSAPARRFPAPARLASRPWPPI